MKKIVLFICFLAIMTFSFIGSDVYAADDVRLFVNNEELVCDVAPVIINSRTMVPVRGIFEHLGAEVSWNGMLNQAIITADDSIMIFTVNSSVAYVNSQIVYLDAAPVIINSRTLVPVRFISENLGYDVRWEDSSRSVYITGGKKETVKNDEDSSGDEKDEKDETAEKSYLAEITAVSIRQKSNNVEITVDITKQIKPKISVLKSPERLVIDFNDALQTCADGKNSNVPAPIKQIRWAKHDTYSRMVVESEKEIKYSCEYKSSGKYVINVQISGESAGGSVSNNSSVKEESDVVTKKPTVNNSGTPTVIIDAGHGGRDSGAVGRNEDGEVVLTEKDVCLDIAKEVAELLEADGIDVVMTRSKDVALGDTTMEDLLARCEIANNSDASLFVSIHNNGFTDPEASGTCVLYAGLSTNEDYGISGKQLAQNILEPLVEVVGLRDRGLVESPNIVVLKRTAMPAALVECAFITCEKDREILASKTKRVEMAEAIYDGIIKSLKQMGRIK